MIKIISETSPIYIRWDEFEERTVPENFSGECVIYIDEFMKDIEGDLSKISKIQRIPGLKQISIHSKDFRVAQYFETGLKTFQVKKEFHLLNDYGMNSRENIDFSNTSYNFVSVPFDYLMHMPNSNISCYTDNEVKKGNCICVNMMDAQHNYQGLPTEINDIIDEIFDVLPMEKLDDVDKSVLVSNWLQRKMQYVNGKQSYVQGKKYVSDGFIPEKEYVLADMRTAIKHNYGVCSTFARLSAALLNNPRVNCQCHLVYSSVGEHTYCVQVIDGKQYVVDNTWGITRNPDKIGETLKAKSFSDEYLLIGNDKLSENEDIRTHHISFGCHEYDIEDIGISKSRIKQSVEKLSGFGVRFSYNEGPVISQRIENEKEL